MSDTLPLLLPEGDRMAGLTIGSLFSGMGGLDRAAEQVSGARIAATRGLKQVLGGES